MPKKVPSFNLPLAEDLFSTQEERDDAKREKVIEVPLVNIDPFPNHPFQVKIDDTMQAMIDSIKAVGIQTPAVVREKEGGRYDMVSGHRRKLACELAGLEVIPCIVRKMSLDEATVIMVDSNLQRELILPSEKGKSYKMKLDAMKRQGQRTDLTSTPLVSRSRTNELVGEAFGESREQVRRYIRLTELIPQILDMVDENTLALRPAVEISYLAPEFQQALLDVIKNEGRVPSFVQASKLRKFFDEGRLDTNVILSIMQENGSATSGHFKLSKEKMRNFFPANTSTQVMEETIIKALEFWRSNGK